jgi:hypothetical protein
VKSLSKLAAVMLADLEANRLEVVLIPSNDPDCAMRGGMIRAVQSQNPRWYSEFCSLYGSSRRRMRAKFDTKIKRARTLRALEMLAEGRNGTEYTQRLKRFISESRYKRLLPELYD